MVHLTQIPNEHFAIGCRDHQFLVDGIHRIDFAVVLFVRANAIFVTRVPQFYRFVPATGQNAIDFRCMLNTFNGIIMRADRCIGVCVQIVVLESVVQTAAHHMNRILKINRNK